MPRLSLEEKKRRGVIIVKELKKLFPKAKMALDFGNHWELVVAVVLSAQCTDKMVNKVTKELFKKYRTLDDYADVKASEFEQDIRSIGLFRSKAKNIIAAAKMLKTDFGGKLPKTVAELTKLPGVGRKTANVVLGNAYGVVEGIAVDTHVRRLAKVYGLTNLDDPKKIEQELMKILSQKEWFHFTYLMIEYGREYAPARKKDFSEDILMKAINA